MSVTNPFFSIIIPTYNRDQLIGKTLQSVLTQTFASFEVIVVDDGGTDQTEEVVKGFSSEQIIYCRKENGERGAARNFGVQRAKGQFLTFLDSDDILYSDHLQEAYNFLRSRPDAACYAQGYEIKVAQTDELLTPAYRAETPTINKELLKGNFLSCFGVFLKKEVTESLHFEEDRRFAGTEDWLLWLQLAARYPFYFNNVCTGALLEHDSRSVLSFNEHSLRFRTEKLKQKLEQDPAFIKAFGQKSIDNIYAHMLSYTSLHLAMSRKKSGALNYLLKAVKVNFSELFTRRSLAITKKILFS